MVSQELRTEFYLVADLAGLSGLVNSLVMSPVGMVVVTNLSAFLTGDSPDIVVSPDVRFERPDVEEGLATLVAHQILLVAVLLDEMGPQLRVAKELLQAVLTFLLRPLFVNTYNVLVKAVLAAV